MEANRWHECEYEQQAEEEAAFTRVVGYPNRFPIHCPNQPVVEFLEACPRAVQIFTPADGGFLEACINFIFIGHEVIGLFQ